jgi:hypothetical protein
MDTSIIQALRDPRFRQDIKGNARDLAQSASNSIAEGVSVPVDALAWALRKAGVNVPSNPLLGSDWMAQQGLTPEVQQGMPKTAGETLGLIAPIAATKNGAAKIASMLGKTNKYAEAAQ